MQVHTELLGAHCSSQKAVFWSHLPQPPSSRVTQMLQLWGSAALLSDQVETYPFFMIFKLARTAPETKEWCDADAALQERGRLITGLRGAVGRSYAKTRAKSQAVTGKKRARVTWGTAFAEVHLPMLLNH